MSEPRHERTDDELASLLRATFSAETRVRVPDSRAVPPFPAATGRVATHPTRRRWVGFSLVAAALVAVLAGATFLATQVVNSERKPIPPGTTAPPTPTVSDTAPTPSTSPTGTPTTSNSAAAATTKPLTVDGVTLTVPSTWGFQPLTDAVPFYGIPRHCIAENPTDRPIDFDPTRCALDVRVIDDVSVSPINVGSYDVPGPVKCGDGQDHIGQLQPATADQVTIDGQTVEHRTFTSGCPTAASAESWTVPTWPSIQFQYLGSGPTPEAVRNAVVSAVLPAPSPLRGADKGYATAVEGNVLSLDRVTVVGTTVINNNPATYAYPIAPDAYISAPNSSGGGEPLTLDQLRALVSGQQVGDLLPIGQLYVVVETSGEQARLVVFRNRSEIN